MNIAFALSFGANGIAYAVFNLARPGTRTPGSFALEGRGLFNWIAVVAMVAFVIAVIRATERQRPIQWLAPLALGVPGLLTAITNGQAERIDLLAFGGTIIYPTTAFALGALAAVFATTASTSLRSYCGLVSAALVINSVDHLGAGLGAGLVAPTTTSSVELTTMTILLAFWLWRADSRLHGRAVRCRRPRTPRGWLVSRGPAIWLHRRWPVRRSRSPRLGARSLRTAEQRSMSVVQIVQPRPSHHCRPSWP